MSASPRVLLAEADAPTRAGLRLSLVRAGFDVVAEAGERDAAVEAALTARPDLALVAADLPGGGIEAARTLGELLPAVKVIVLTSRTGGGELVEAVLAGASGYLGKDMSPARLPHALEAVLQGEVALPRRYTRYLLEELRHRDIARTEIAAHAGVELTDREWEVLQCLGKGLTTPEIAQRLEISEVTVRRHVSSLMRKLGVRDRTGAVELLHRRSIG